MKEGYYSHFKSNFTLEYSEALLLCEEVARAQNVLGDRPSSVRRVTVGVPGIFHAENVCCIRMACNLLPIGGYPFGSFDPALQPLPKSVSIELDYTIWVD